MKRNVLFRVALCIIVVFAGLGIVASGDLTGLVVALPDHDAVIGVVARLVFVLALLHMPEEMERYRKWCTRELGIWSRHPRTNPI